MTKQPPAKPLDLSRRSRGKKRDAQSPGTTGLGGFCNYTKRDGNHCRNKAGYRTEHPGYGACYAHGGTSASHNRRALRMQVAELAAEMRLDPATALLRALWATCGVVAWLQNQIQTLEDEGTDLVADDAQREAKLMTLLVIYGEERDRQARIAKMTLDAGLAERQVRLAERQGEMIAHAIRSILGELDLSPEQMRVAPGAVRRQLLALAAGPDDAEVAEPD